MRHHTQLVSLQIPSFPAGDYWEHFVMEYIRGRYTPKWIIKKVPRHSLNEFYSKYPLAQIV